MWLCTNWVYDAQSFAAWGTWAAVVVALGVGLVGAGRRWWRGKLEARLLAALLFHEVAQARQVLYTIKALAIPESNDGGMLEYLLTTEVSKREELAFHIERARLPSLVQWADRLSLLPRDAAIAVGELQSHLSFLAFAGQALATKAEPPAAFFPEFRANVLECLKAADIARDRLLPIGFPDGRPRA